MKEFELNQCFHLNRNITFYIFEYFRAVISVNSCVKPWTQGHPEVVSELQEIKIIFHIIVLRYHL